MKTIMVRAEDVEQAALAAADTVFHQDYGPETGWQPWQREHYLTAVDNVHHQFAGEES